MSSESVLFNKELIEKIYREAYGNIPKKSTYYIAGDGIYISTLPKKEIIKESDNIYLPK